MTGPHGIVRAVLAGLDVSCHRHPAALPLFEITVTSQTGQVTVTLPADDLDDLDRFGAALIVDELVDTAVDTLLDAATESVRER